MSARHQVLDHGYFEVIETWGSDERIIEAARMSTGKGFEGWGARVVEGACGQCDGQGIVDDRGYALRGQPFFEPKTCHVCEGDKRKRAPGDEKLLRRLWEHKHATPFEMAGAIIEVQAPIMVFREWHRHRTQSYNEMSARYTPLPDLNYVPSVERLMRNAGTTNKQAGTIADSDALTVENADALMVEEREFNAAAERFYQKKLEAGVPKELARTHLGVSRYSRMRASALLRNWLAFLTLRDHEDAQWEIRQYAIQVHEALRETFPRTLALFDESTHK